MKTESLKNKWIYWRWKKDKKSFIKSRVQNIVKTKTGDILELVDTDIYSHYPNRVLTKEIQIA